MILKTVSITVTGKVQGVWFRKYTMDKAQELGVKGFVKNLPDDSVYIVATGDSEQLKELENWCWQGSPKSKVSSVDVTTMEISNFSSFTNKK